MTDSKYISAKLRRLVAERAKFICEYCRSQESFSADSFSVEHILPRVLGGQSVSRNLAFSCQGCNSHKAVKTNAYDSLSEVKVKLFNPRLQNWNDHFAWNKNFTEIIGLTPNGRATVESLKLNRTGVKNLRWALFSIGKHPPED